MENLPHVIPFSFILTTLLALFLLYKAAGYSRPLIILITLWLALQAIISQSGFYTNTSVSPPRFAFKLLLPPVTLVVCLLLFKKGRQMTDGFDVKALTLFHIVRIPVELILYWLYLHKAVSKVMTFEGMNLDILCGLTAPFVYYFGYVKNKLGRPVLIAWNVACLCLLVNVVAIAILSAPFPFQRLGFDQPTIAILYFPFVWLPGFIVPAALFAHLVCLRRMIVRAR